MRRTAEWQHILRGGAQGASLLLIAVLMAVWERRWRLQMRLLAEHREREAQLARRAFRDALTDLPNRALLSDRLEHALARLQRHNTALALLFLDLDQFKAINDQHGHTVGDEVLKRVAQRLSDSVRASDTVARLGGDEFLVLVEDLKLADVATEIAERLAAAFDTPLRVDHRDIELSISIGGIVATVHEGDAASLLRGADAALHEAKQPGNPRVVILPDILAHAAFTGHSD